MAPSGLRASGTFLSFTAMFRFTHCLLLISPFLAVWSSVCLHKSNLHYMVSSLCFLLKLPAVPLRSLHTGSFTAWKDGIAAKLTSRSNCLINSGDPQIHLGPIFPSSGYVFKIVSWLVKNSLQKFLNAPRGRRVVIRHGCFCVSCRISRAVMI